MQNQKARYVWRVIQLIMKLGQCINEAKELSKIFFDRGYGPGSADPIVDADLQVSIASEGIDLTGIQVTDLGQIVSAADLVITFMEGTLTAAQYTPQDLMVLYSKYRRDL